MVKTLTIFLFFLVTSCTHVFYQPSKRQFFDPAQIKMDYQDVYFPSKDGTKLHGWFFKTKQKTVKGTVIQFHGNAQNLSSHFITLAWMVAEGYNLFAFDYRGYGKSEGNSEINGVYEDSLAALAKGIELRDQNGGGKYITYGQSLGGIILLRALPDFKQNPEVDFVVQDSTFASYKDIAFNRLSSVWFALPFSPLAYLFVSDKYASDKVFKKITWPTLVIAGKKDHVIPKKFGKEIYKGIASPHKWLWEAPEVGHIDVFFAKKGEYRKDFLELLDQVP